MRNSLVDLVSNVFGRDISVCAAWLVCYIKCKQLRPRVDVEIVRGAPAGARQRWAACAGAGARLGHTPWSGLASVECRV